MTSVEESKKEVINRVKASKEKLCKSKRSYDISNRKNNDIINNKKIMTSSITEKKITSTITEKIMTSTIKEKKNNDVNNNRKKNNTPTKIIKTNHNKTNKTNKQAIGPTREREN